MQNTHKGSLLKLLITILTLIIIGGGLYMFMIKERDSSAELMSISLYVQDEEAARSTDCSVTKQITYEIPKTSDVLDASLHILFENELSQYGVYDSVTVTNGVARVMLKSDMNSMGRSISSLSSCESGHLLSVVSDTLMQYETITSVELYSPDGQITF